MGWDDTTIPLGLRVIAVLENSPHPPEGRDPVGVVGVPAPPVRAQMPQSA